MRRRATVVLASWPVAILVLPQWLDEAAARDLMAQMEDLYAREQLYALITDTRQLASVPRALERKLLTDWLTRPDQIANQRKWNVGASTVVSNTLLRGALQAIYWVWSPPNPQHAAGNMDEAWTYCLRMLDQRGVPLGRPAEELRRIADDALRPR